MPNPAVLQAVETQKTILPEETKTLWCFVCSGNTCRSPMAAAAANKLLRERGIFALSAGLSVPSPAPIAPNAVLALEARGIHATPENNYRLHSAAQLDEKTLARADRVFGMTESHALAILVAFPRFAEKLSPFGANVPDPYGGDLNAYLSALDLILDALGRL